MKGMNDMNANNEVDILTQALMLAGSVAQADKAQQLKHLERLKQSHVLAQATTLEVHRELKRLSLLTVSSAIRFVENSKQSDAKLTLKNGQKAAKELGRLKRLAQRREKLVSD